MNDGFMASCKIFSEDTYGTEFFRRLAERLKKEDLNISTLSKCSSFKDFVRAF